jgi:hypothetical protein
MTVEDVRKLIHADNERLEGANADNRLKNLARQLPKDPVLADELYQEEDEMLRVLATYIDAPDSYTRDELHKRADSLTPSPCAERFCTNVVARSPYAVHFIDEWANCSKGDFECYAYHTLAEVARQKNCLSDDFYANYLRNIASKIDEAPETVRVAMMHALKSIASRDAKLKRMCEEISGRMGALNLKRKQAFTGAKVHSH